MAYLYDQRSFFLQIVMDIPQVVREYVIFTHGQFVDWDLSVEAA